MNKNLSLKASTIWIFLKEETGKLDPEDNCLKQKLTTERFQSVRNDLNASYFFLNICPDNQLIS